LHGRMPSECHNNGGGAIKMTISKEKGTNLGNTFKLLTGNHAAAHAFRQARVGVISAYPITPQSPVVEKVAEFIAKGEMDTKFVKVESEHSALAVCCAASATGSRVGTATASHGLMLMYEMLLWAAGNRLPVVLCLATRAVGAPWSVWNDDSDFIAIRDTGWIQIMCEDNQEIYDTVLQAYKIAEDPRVFLPICVGYSGYLLSHTIMPVKIESQEDVDEFLPPLRHHINLSDLSIIKGVDPVTTPHVRDRGKEGIVPGYFEYRYSLQKALENSIDIIKEVHDDFAKKFGRSYGNGIFKTFEVDDADIIIFAMGSISAQARIAVNQLRKEGLKIGLVTLRVFRPFPAKMLRELLKEKSIIVAFDRNIGYGYQGVLCYELKSALYGVKNAPYIKGYIVGLGGRDVKTSYIIEGVKRTITQAETQEITHETEFLGLRQDVLNEYDESEFFKGGENK